MCYAAPGPRCSSHAKARYIALRQKRSELLKAKGDNWDALAAVEAEIADAELDYDSTPVGQARLELRIKQGMDYDGVETEKLANARELRKRQLAAIKAKDVGDIHEHNESVPAWADGKFSSRKVRRKNWQSESGHKQLKAYIEYAKHFAQKLSTEEATALYWHTSDGASAVNGHLHKENAQDTGKWTYDKVESFPTDYPKEMVEKQIATLDGIFAKHSLDKPAMLYRGFGKNNLPDQLQYADHDSAEVAEFLNDTYPIGKKIKMHQYMSTSADPAAAHKFSGFQHLMFEIKTKQAVPVAMMSAWDASEREFVVNRGVEYRVVNVLKNVTYEDVFIKTRASGPNNPNVTVVQLEEI